MTTSKQKAIAHPNIALAKYWGKQPGDGNVPAVPSLSVTLSGMSTVTTVEPDPSLEADVLVLNGVQADAHSTGRAAGLLARVREASGVRAFSRVTSTNDFPTAAGLASSASGFAALALAARAAHGLPLDLAATSDLARRTSASSGRSLYGGFVALPAAAAPAEPVAPPDHLDLRVLVAVTTERTKDVSSTLGMGHTAATSPFYAAWVDLGPRLYDRIRQALLRRDLEALGEAAEQSALAMHASAIASAPGVVYWNGATVEAIHAVRALRAAGVGAWVTIDAGPHAKVLCAAADEARVCSAMHDVPGVLRVIATRPGPGARLEAP